MQSVADLKHIFRLWQNVLFENAASLSYPVKYTFAEIPGMPSIRDIMESEDEEEDDDDEDDDFEDESLAERLAGLAEMFPDGFTDGCVNMAKVCLCITLFAGSEILVLAFEMA